MKIFEVCLTNYCNFKCTYCISDNTRGNDKFSEPLKLDSNGDLLLHDKELKPEEVAIRADMLENLGQAALDSYVAEEHTKWESTRHLKHDYTDWLDFDALVNFIGTSLDSTWMINLTGGEPLYYPKIEELIHRIVETNVVLVTTNASMLKNKPSLLEVDRKSLFFRVGYHPEFRTEASFRSAMSHIVSNGYRYLVNYVLHPEYYENSTKYVDHLKVLDEMGLEYEITPFEGKYNGVSYPKKTSDRSELEVALLGRNEKFEPVSSKMGTVFLICEPNGKIYECQGRYSELGDVYRNELTLKRVMHGLCFTTKGCQTLKSANQYLDIFMNDRVG